MPGAPGPIRWATAIVGGTIAEGLTIASIALVAALTGHAGPGPGGAPDPVVPKLAGLVHLSAGSALVYVSAWWAARRAGGRFETHGLIVGATTALLAGLSGMAGRGVAVVLLVPIMVVDLFAGRAGGVTASRMASR